MKSISVLENSATWQEIYNDARSEQKAPAVSEMFVPKVHLIHLISNDRILCSSPFPSVPRASCTPSRMAFHRDGDATRAF